MCCFLIHHELEAFIKVRSTYVLSRRLHTGLKPTAILLSNISSQLLAVHKIHELFRGLPGGVQTVIINRDCRALSKQIEDRAEAVEALESAVTRLVTRSLRKSKASTVYHSTRLPCLPEQSEPIHAAAWHSEPEVQALRKGFRGLLSSRCSQSDSQVIDRVQAAISQANKEISTIQSSQHELKLLNSAFILFNDIQAAELASNLVLIDCPRQLTLHFVGNSAEGIHWSAVGTSWWGFQVRTLAVTAIITALCIGWTIPVALRGVISQITYLTRVLP